MARRKTRTEPVLVVLRTDNLQVINNQGDMQRAPSVYSYEADAIFNLLHAHVSWETITQLTIGIHAAMESRGIHTDLRQFRNAISHALEDGARRFQDCDWRPRYGGYDDTDAYDGVISHPWMEDDGS